MTHSPAVPAPKPDAQTARRLSSLLERIQALLERSPHVSVALDGPAAAGKSLTAAWLAARFDCRLVHMDDFFLPPELRTPDRLAEPGGNIHYERFLEQVLPALRSGDALDYPAFDCAHMAYGARRQLPPRTLTVVEGVYSQHPRFGTPYGLTVFLTVDPEEQRRRILARDGPDMLDRYLRQWIPLEERYFTHCHTREHADLVL